MTLQHFATNKLFPVLKITGIVGGAVGILTGMIPGTTLFIKCGSTDFQVRHSLPLLVGMVGMVGCPTIILCSPVIFINHFCEFSTADRFVDKLCEKYSIEVKRYHQYGGVPPNNKYYAPSRIMVNISLNHHL